MSFSSDGAGPSQQVPTGIDVANGENVAAHDVIDLAGPVQHSAASQSVSVERIETDKPTASSSAPASTSILCVTRKQMQQSRGSFMRIDC